MLELEWLHMTMDGVLVDSAPVVAPAVKDPPVFRCSINSFPELFICRRKPFWEVLFVVPAKALTEADIVVK